MTAPAAKKIRIGAQMRAVMTYVSDKPGCSKGEAARAAGSRGQVRDGYAAVDRAIAAGLISATRNANGYALYVTPPDHVISSYYPCCAHCEHLHHSGPESGHRYPCDRRSCNGASLTQQER